MKVRYSADGIQTVFPLPWWVPDQDSVVVFIGEQAQAGGFDVQTGDAGLVIFAIPPATGSIVTVIRDITGRSVTYTQGSAISAAALNADLNRLSARIDDLQSGKLGLSPGAAAMTAPDLPAPVPDSALCWDSDGRLTTRPITDAGIVVPLSNGAFHTGPTAPTAASLNLPGLSGVIWHDTGNALLKLRDQADSAWILIGIIDEVTKTFYPAGRLAPALGLELDGSGGIRVKLADASLQLSAAGLSVSPQPPAPHLRRSQVVLSACGDNNTGTPFLTAGSGFSVSLLATAVPVVVAFATGYGIHGEEDVVSQISADISNAWGGLPANSTSYLFIDRNPANGALTFAASPLPLLPQHGGITPVAAGQSCYRTDLRKSFIGTGSVASVAQRVAVGQCQTNASGVIPGSIITYALNGRAISSQMAMNGDALLTFQHNIGTDMVSGAVKLTALQAVGMFTAGQKISSFHVLHANGGYITTSGKPDCQPLSATFRPGGNSILVPAATGVAEVVASAAYVSKFSVCISVERDFF